MCMPYDIDLYTFICIIYSCVSMVIVPSYSANAASHIEIPGTVGFYFDYHGAIYDVAK